MIIKPGMYLVALLVLTALRFLQMSVLLAQHQRALQPPGNNLRAMSHLYPFALGLEDVTGNTKSLRSELPLPLPQSPSNALQLASVSLLTTMKRDSSALCDELRLLPSLSDPTIRLTPCLQRPWLDESSRNSQRTKEKPPVRIVLTNFGWNHPNKTEGLQHPRSLRTRELLQAVVDHPYFDPTGWESYQQRKRNKAGGGGGGGGGGGDDDDDENNHFRYLVFLDVETCHESNYPVYGNPVANQDTEGGRTAEPTRWNLQECRSADRCDAVRAALASPLFRENPSAKLMYWDCRGNNGSGNGPSTSSSSTDGSVESVVMSQQIALASLSADSSQLRPNQGDQGLAPPVNARQFRLSPRQVRNIAQCDESDRPYLLSFVGAIRRDSPRSRLLDLHNETGGVIVRSRAQFREDQQERQQQQQQKDPQGESSSQHYSQLTYEELLQRSQFAAAPRGTNLFSYRFSEALASGSIPVVHSDGWALPFSPAVVDWTECAVVIPERRVPQTPAILRNLPADERCRRRKACYRIYKSYFETPAGTVRGVLEGLEAALSIGDSEAVSEARSAGI